MRLGEPTFEKKKLEASGTCCLHLFLILQRQLHLKRKTLTVQALEIFLVWCNLPLAVKVLIKKYHCFLWYKGTLWLTSLSVITSYSNLQQHKGLPSAVLTTMLYLLVTMVQQEWSAVLFSFSLSPEIYHTVSLLKNQRRCFPLISDWYCDLSSSQTRLWLCGNWPATRQTMVWQTNPWLDTTTLCLMWWCHRTDSLLCLAPGTIHSDCGILIGQSNKLDRRFSRQLWNLVTTPKID